MRFNEYTVGELQAVSRKGGVASGKARREKRASIEQEKVENMALREMHIEHERQKRDNLRMIRGCLKLLRDAKRCMEKDI